MMGVAQYRIATLLALIAAVSAICGLIRWELPGSVIALGVLFGVFVFAEDIWKWLPR
jgi:putative effector of murein hydrolase LrgA (UPF0299 family)